MKTCIQAVGCAAMLMACASAPATEGRGMKVIPSPAGTGNSRIVIRDTLNSTGSGQVELLLVPSNCQIKSSSCARQVVHSRQVTTSAGPSKFSLHTQTVKDGVVWNFHGTLKVASNIVCLFDFAFLPRADHTYLVTLERNARAVATTPAPSRCQFNVIDTTAAERSRAVPLLW